MGIDEAQFFDTRRDGLGADRCRVMQESRPLNKKCARVAVTLVPTRQTPRHDET